MCHNRHTFVLADDNTVQLTHESDPFQTILQYCNILDYHEGQIYWSNVQRMIYGAFDLISTLAASLAIGIFIYFKNLHCTKNWIHVHLLVSLATYGNLD